MSEKIVEYRGVEGLVAAELLADDAENLTYDTPFEVAGTAQVQKTVANATEAHYYDNIPAIVIESEGADTITFNVSALSLAVTGALTGQDYDADLGALSEGSRTPKYFAVGYKTKKTDGTEVFVWRYKGTFQIPDVTSSTEDAGTSANGQTLVFTGINTQHKFAKTEKTAKGLVVDCGLEKANVATFFDAVTTIDTLAGKTARTLTITQAANTTLTVKKNGVTLATGATVYDGDQLKITVTGGTVKVNNVAFTSGDIHIVSGNTTIASTASA